MAVEVITPHFECVMELKTLLKTLSLHRSLNTSDGPKYMFFTTRSDDDMKTRDGNEDLDAICAQICGHMLSLAEMNSPLIEAALMCFKVGTVGMDIKSERRATVRGDAVYHIEISDPKNKLIFKELGPLGSRYCDLTYIRV